MVFGTVVADILDEIEDDRCKSCTGEKSGINSTVIIALRHSGSTCQGDDIDESAPGRTDHPATVFPYQSVPFYLSNIALLRMKNVIIRIQCNIFAALFTVASLIPATINFKVLADDKLYLGFHDFWIFGYRNANISWE